MDAPRAPHPDDRTLEAYGLGRLDDRAAETVDRHLEGCPACRSQVAGFTSDTFLDRLRHPASPTDRAGPASVAFRSPDGGARPAALSPSSTLPPELADHPDYRIERELGRGGMAVVYLAHNTLMGRPEVLKVVAAHLVSRPGAVDRFLREIRSAARLHHPHIVTAYTALRLDEGLVLAMEYVEGRDLARLVEAKGRCRSSTPATSPTRRPTGCSTRANTAWSTATSSRPT
jgi:serine/threonine-protein kinase